MNKTIYVSIPSLYDEELAPTIADAFNKADNPERIFVGVSLADISDTILKQLEIVAGVFPNVRYKFDLLSKDNSKHLRVGYGRLSAMSMYENEDYVLQTDSHAAFGNGWDTKLINLHSLAKEKTKNDKVVITAYGGSYAYSQELGRHLDPAEPDVTISGFLPKYPVFVSEMYNNAIPSWTVEKEESLKALDLEELIPGIKFNANFAFSDRHFAKAETMFEHVEFFEEELIQTVMLIENGFSIVFPNVDYPLVCHLYTERINKDSAGRGTRFFSGKYKEFGIEPTNNRAKYNHLAFIDDPKHQDAIKRYQKYARMNMRFGTMFNNDLYIPKYFINSEGK